jgi:hypothetical protein
MTNKQGQPKLTQKQAQWLAHIHSADQAGMSLSAYAEQHNLSLKRLYNWRWHLRKQGHYIDQATKPSASAGFVEVRTCAPTTSLPPSIRAHLPNGVRLELNGESSELAHLLRLVSQL